MFDSVSRFLLASSKRRPIVILLDNLHLADRSSLDLLGYFSQQISSYSIQVIAAYRSGESESSDNSDNNKEPLMSALERLALSAHYSRLILNGLARNEVAQLLREHSKIPVPISLVDSVFRQSDGNPLFVTEVARMLRQRPLELPLPGPGVHFDVPTSLRSVIETRLDVLPDTIRVMLGKASVLGRNFDVSSCQDLLGNNSEQVVALTQSAEQAAILQLVKPGGYRFQHALHREVLYSQLDKTTRTEMHLAAAQHFEKLWNLGVDTALSPLAHHYFEVASFGYAKQAIQYNREAATAAREQRAYSEAASFFEQELFALELGSDADFRSEFDLLLSLGKVLFRGGQQNAATKPLLRACELAQKKGDWNALADALAEFQFVRGQMGFSHEACLPLIHLLLSKLPQSSRALRIRALACLADAHRLAGDNDLAVKTAVESMELARELGDPMIRLDCYCRGIWALGCTSINPESVDYRHILTAEIREIAEAHGSADETLLVMSSLNFILASRSSAEQLQEHMLACRRLVASEFHPHHLILLANFEISVNILQGKWNDAIQGAMALRQKAYLQDVEGMEGSFGQQMFVIQRARGQLLAGAALFKRIEVDVDPDKLWLPGQMMMHCELKNFQRARELLARLGDIGKIKRDGLYLCALVYLAEACIALNDRLRLIELYKLLKPFQSVMATIPGTILIGAVSGYMALIAARLGKKIRACELFEDALTLNSQMAAAPWIARVQTDYAQFLLRSRNDQDHARAQKLVASARRIANDFGLVPIITRLDDMASDADIGQLTKRERTVLEHIANGSSNKQIAAGLSVSLSTVATHVRNILHKLHVANRTEATDFARRAGWLD